MRSTSPTGAVGRSPRSARSRNTGVSSIRTRIHRPNATSSADSRNASRQPQAREALLRAAMSRSTAEHGIGGQRPDRRPHLRGRGPEAAITAFAELAAEQHRPAPFAADADALREPQHHQQQTGAITPASAYRLAAGRCRRWRRRPAAGSRPAPSCGRSRRRAGRTICRRSAPREIADRIGGERLQRAGAGIAVGKEQLPEQQGRGDIVDSEIIPFERGARQAGDERPQLAGRARSAGRSPDRNGLEVARFGAELVRPGGQIVHCSDHRDHVETGLLAELAGVSGSGGMVVRIFS